MTTTMRVAVLLIGFGTVHAKPIIAQGLSALDSVMVMVANEVLARRADANALWSRDWFSGDFALLRPEGGAMLVIGGPPPETWGAPDTTLALRDSLAAAHFYFGYRPALPERLGRVILGSRQLMAWPFQHSVYSIDDPVTANVAVILHEAFHLYQRRTGWFGRLPPMGREPPPAIVTSEAFQERAALERELLSRALDQASVDSLRATLIAYIDVRVARTSLLPSEVRQWEAVVEQYEATPQFISYSAVLGPSSRFIDTVQADLAATPRFDDQSRSLGAYRQWHVYGTGVAIGILLERMGIEWKRRVELGETLMGLLEESVAGLE
jgi:hypothetical protein